MSSRGRYVGLSLPAPLVERVDAYVARQQARTGRVARVRRPGVLEEAIERGLALLEAEEPESDGASEEAA